MTKGLTSPIVESVRAPIGSVLQPSDSGGIYDFTNPITLFQNSAGTIPVQDGDPVGYVRDISGKDNHGVQTSNGFRPLWNDGGHIELTSAGIRRLVVAVALTQPFYVACCCEVSDLAGTEGMVSGNGGSEGFLGHASNEAVRIFSGSNLSASNALGPNVLHVARGLFSGSTSQVGQNEESVNTGDAGDQDWSEVQLGGYTSVEGKLRRVFFMDRAPTALEESWIIEWLGG